MLGSSVGSEAAGAAGGRGEEWIIPRMAHLLWLCYSLLLLLAILSASEPGSGEDTEVPPIAMKLPWHLSAHNIRR